MNRIKEVLDEMELDLFSLDLSENYWNVTKEDELAPGVYNLSTNIASPMTGEIIAKEGTKVIVPAMCEHVDVVFGVPIYKVKHSNTKMDIYVSPGDIKR